MSELKPFDWDTYAASVKAGEPLKVQTRDGREVTQIARFDVKGEVIIAGVRNGEIYRHRLDGKAQTTRKDSRFDLAFAPRTRTVWHLAARFDDADPYHSLFYSKEEAEAWRDTMILRGYVIVDEFTREIPA